MASNVAKSGSRRRSNALKSYAVLEQRGLASASPDPDISHASDRGRLNKGFAHMSDFNRGYSRTVSTDRADMSVDVGLRSFMLGVYNKVGLGLVLSAALA